VSWIELKVEQEFSYEVKKLVNYFPSSMAIEIDLCFIAAIFPLSAATKVDQFVRTLQTKSYCDKRGVLFTSIIAPASCRLDRLHCYDFHHHVIIIIRLILLHNFKVDFEHLLQAVQNFYVQGASFL